MKAHTMTILSWRNILTNKLTLINDKRTFFQLLFNLEKARKKETFNISRCLICLRRYTSCEQHLSLYAHTHISSSRYIHIALASSNVSRRIRLEPVHTHTHIYNLFLFQSDSGVGMSRERDGQSKWENVIDANGTSSLTPFFSLSFMQYFIYPFC